MNVRQHVLNLVSGRPGGITSADVAEELWKSQVDAGAVKDAIWSLLSEDKLVINQDKLLNLPVQEPTKPKGGRGPSGIRPVGPGDTLFNSDGEPVAVVADIDRDRDGRVILTVTASFSTLTGGAGTSAMNTYGGKVLGGIVPPEKKCYIDHEKFVEARYDSRPDKVSLFVGVACPECKLWLTRKRTDLPGGPDWKLDRAKKRW